MLTPFNSILTVEHLSMRFGGLQAVADLSFSVERGSITALIGPNGAGKTTVFNCITGFYKPTTGMIRVQIRRRGAPADRLHGQELLLERLRGHEIARRARVARTFQNIRLFAGMTVLENLMVAQHNPLMRASGYSVLGLFGARSYQVAEGMALDRARNWLAEIRLVERANDLAGELPYGDQRRLEIARAMCSGDVELLCLDEPAAGLNPRESRELSSLLRMIRDHHDTSILIIEHDMSVVKDVSDHIIVLDHGEKIAEGTFEKIRQDKDVVAAYLGTPTDEPLGEGLVR